MSRAVLGLLALLFVLIAIGIVTHSYKEYFSGQMISAVPPTQVSPVMANLTDAMTKTDRSKELPQINTIRREADIIQALNDQERNRKDCPVCKEQCPDMSKYIRRDSIPCWNCSL